MSSSLFDHFKVSGEDHGGQLFFSPRVFGDAIPYRATNGVVPPLKKEEVEELDHRAVAFTRLFDTSDPEQKREYETILTRKVNNWYEIVHRHHYFDPEKKAMLVYVEWVQPYRVPPDYIDRMPTETSVNVQSGL